MNTFIALIASSIALTFAQDPAKQPPKPEPAKQVPADPSKERLDKSPRHHEWIEVRVGDKSVRSFVVYPEVKGKAAAVLVIHENKGLTDWVRAVADQLGEAGYIAIAPDLLSGAGPKGGNTDSFASVDDATQAIYKLDDKFVTSALDAVSDYVVKLPSASGKLSVAGFCWGGGQSFAFATARKSLAAAFVFYGPAPKDDALAKINCPVYGFYGESDSRITSSTDATKDAMKTAGKSYDPVVYSGAGHGFMRMGEATDASKENKQARDDAWKRWKDLLAKAAK